MPSPRSFSLTAHAVSFARGDQQILDRVDLTIGPGTRVGVVGPNGAGKSTLLRILAGVEHPDTGAVAASPDDLRVAYLPQESDPVDGTVRGLLARRTGVAAVTAQLEGAGRAVAADEPGAPERYAAALDTFLVVRAADFDARATAVAAEVGLPIALLDRPPGSLSGGEAARAALAAVLLVRADVVLLDEPTNDLDFAGLEHLEGFVASQRGGVVLVSHDRSFLERTATSILELDGHTHQARLFRGGWASYLDERAVSRRHGEERYREYEAERARLRRRAQRQREWATRGTRRAQRDTSEPDKLLRNMRIAASEQLATKAKASERALERLPEVDKPWEGWDLRFQIADAPRSGAVAFRLSDARIERGALSLGPVNVEVRWADRIAIVGPNGAGKTTLLAALLGDVPLTTGDRWIGPSVVVGNLDQRRQRLLGDATLLDLLPPSGGLRTADVRSQLAKFGLGASQLRQPTATLSPGERSRAILAEFALRGVNCLVLDEPTNQLDVPAIEELESALDQYPGTLLLVSHDRALLEHVEITRHWVIRGATVEEA